MGGILLGRAAPISVRTASLQLLTSLLDACGEPAHLVGHSYGGTVALNAVRRFPRRVASLTLIEPVAFPLLRNADELNDWREVAALAEQHIALTAQGHDIEASRAFITYWMGSAAWQQMPEVMRDSIVQTIPKVAAEWRLMFALHDDLDTIAGIHTPTLLICGGRTRKPARRVMEKIRSALPEAHYLEIPDAGHMSSSFASSGGGGCDSGPHRLRSSLASPGGMTRRAASALISALGQKRTFALQKGMSALAPKADMPPIIQSPHRCVGVTKAAQ